MFYRRIAEEVFRGDEFLGALSGCGLLVDGSNVGTFLIKTITGIDEKEITSLSNNIEKIERDKVELVVEYLEYRVEGIVQNFVLYAPS